VLSIITKFRVSGIILWQRKGKSYRRITVSAKENCALVLQQALHSPWWILRRTALKMKVSHIL
jgi:hypothetical protein